MTVVVGGYADRNLPGVRAIELHIRGSGRVTPVLLNRRAVTRGEAVPGKNLLP